MPILYFILGIVSYIIVIPLFEQLASLLATLLEIPKGKASLKISNINKKLKKNALDDEEISTNVIGFQCDPVEYYDDEEDEEEDDI